MQCAPLSLSLSRYMQALGLSGSGRERERERERERDKGIEKKRKKDEIEASCSKIIPTLRCKLQAFCRKLSSLLSLTIGLPLFFHLSLIIPRQRAAIVAAQRLPTGCGYRSDARSRSCQYPSQLPIPIHRYKCTHYTYRERELITPFMRQMRIVLAQMHTAPTCLSLRLCPLLAMLPRYVYSLVRLEYDSQSIPSSSKLFCYRKA